VNLLKTLKQRKIRPRKSNWTVCKSVNGKVFFIHYIDEDTGALVWTSAAQKAVKFRTERGCQLYVSTSINGRKDVFVGTLAGAEK